MVENPPLSLSTLKFTAEQSQDLCLCIANPEHPLELTSEGIVVIMTPAGAESGGQLFVWNEATQLGKAFSSSTVFKLPLGSRRSRHD
jgi:Uma2 family endonuclease